MFQPQSPGGRWIEEVEGDPEAIMARGEEIRVLGQQMLDCASTLATIKSQALADGGQQGQAIEKLKEQIGDSHDVLRQAGDLYEPVGPVISAYGSSLSTLQPIINRQVEDCESKWTYYFNLPGDAEGNTTPEAGGSTLGLGGYDADSPEAAQEARENQEKKDAYEAWEFAATCFDGQYDSWERAFDDAVGGVEDEMADSIKDSFWSDITDFLEIAAFIVGVAALIIGTPFMAAIAMVVGALLLVATIMAYVNGERSMTDIVFAGIAIVPFGKVLKISGASRMVQALRGAKGAKWGNVKTVLGQMNGLKGMRGFVSSVRSNGIVSTVKAGDGLIGIYSQRGGSPMLTKLFTGSERGFRDTRRFHNTLLHGAEQVMKDRRASNLTKGLMGADFGSQVLATNLDHIKLASLLTPGVDFEVDLPGPLDRVVG